MVMHSLYDNVLMANQNIFMDGQGSGNLRPGWQFLAMFEFSPDPRTFIYLSRNKE